MIHVFPLLLHLFDALGRFHILFSVKHSIVTAFCRKTKANGKWWGHIYEEKLNHVNFISAGGGMGKSTAMKHLAISWADGTSEELKKFDIVFHISLKLVRDNSPIELVRDNSPIESIIIAQHVGLKANGVKSEEINGILNGKFKSKTLLLIDGHDEYKSGTNTDIDDAIRKEKLWNCWMILTSRETTQLGDVKQYMDAEVEIRGFDSTNIKSYVSRSLGGEEIAEKLLDQVEQTGLIVFSESILAIPILLHMICVLFVCNMSLPKTKTGIIQAIVNRCMDREAIRARGQKAVDTANQALYNLGKLAWQGLNEAGKKLYFSKLIMIYHLLDIFIV